MGKSLFKFIVLLAALLCAADQARAAKEIDFSISGVDPVNVMRFRDPSGGRVRVGYIQSTEFSHTVREGPQTIEGAEDGILYYGVMLEKLEDGTFQLEITYDFASADGRSEGTRNRSVVTPELLKSLTPEALNQRARIHADAFANAVFDYFLKYKLEEETRPSLVVFLTEITADLLKTMPRDALMIIRRWDDLTGMKGA